MHICTVIKDTVQSLKTEQNKYVFKRDLCDGAHLTSFGIEFQTEKKQKKMNDHQVLPYCVQVY